MLPFLAGHSLSSALRVRLAHSASVWVGALSFEERCVASLRELSRLGCLLSRGYILNYSTRAEPQYWDARLRTKNREIINGLGASIFLGAHEELDVDAHSVEGILSFFDRILNEQDHTVVICDVTCLTKIHAIALASAMAKHSIHRFVLVYSLPENYVIGEERGEGVGWRDVLVAPISLKAVLSNETRSRGIILLGHESDRLVVALSEFEPAGGTVLLASTHGRPDLRRKSKQLNNRMLKHLTGLQSQPWKTAVLELEDLAQLRKCVHDEVTRAKQFGAPVVLFPFGPKPLILMAALQLRLEYPEASWFVYPVRSAYETNYTEGIQGCLWLEAPGLQAET